MEQMALVVAGLLLGGCVLMDGEWVDVTEFRNNEWEWAGQGFYENDNVLSPGMARLEYQMRDITIEEYNWHQFQRGEKLTYFDKQGFEWEYDTSSVERTPAGTHTRWTPGMRKPLPSYVMPKDTKPLFGR